jgi:hypothetical protein
VRRIGQHPIELPPSELPTSGFSLNHRERLRTRQHVIVCR